MFWAKKWSPISRQHPSALHLPRLPEPPTHDLTYTRNARASTSPRSIGFCVIWDCISSSSSSNPPAEWEYSQPERTHPRHHPRRCSTNHHPTNPNPRHRALALRRSSQGGHQQAASPTRLRLLAPGPASPSKRADRPSHIKLTHLGRLTLDSCSSNARRTQPPRVLRIKEVCFSRNKQLGNGRRPPSHQTPPPLP